MPASACRRDRPVRPVRRDRLLTALALATIAALGSCSGEGPTSPTPAPTVASITVTPGADTLVTLGRTQQFSAVPRDAAGDVILGATIRWRSTDTLIARVDSITGLMTATGEGTATISAVNGTVTGTALVHIIQFVAGVTITPGTSTLVTVGQQQPFTAVARDSSNAIVDGVRFLWGSSNPGVALVDTLGVARAQASGTVTISATGRGTPGYAELVVDQAATHLAFTVEPSNSVAGVPMNPAIQVEVRDASGARVTTSRAEVTLAFPGSSNGATIGGTRTVNAIDGVASFSGIWLDLAWDAHQLSAFGTGLAPDTSDFFAITAGPLDWIAPSIAPSYEAAVAPAGTMGLYGYDEFNNPVTPVGATATLVFTPGRSAIGFQMTATTSPEVGRLDFSGPTFDRPASDQLIRFSVGSGASTVVALSPPIRVQATPSEVDAGNSHACLRAPGNTFCWGFGSDGQLGASGFVLSDSLPVPVLGGEGLVSLAAGTDFTCALDASGAAYCWGGRFGNGTGAAFVSSTGPGGIVLTSVAAGAFACGLTAAGGVYCWGANPFGLGDGATTDSDTPVHVAGTGNPGMEMTRIAVGFQHACALNAAGEAWCWGENSSGELADSTTTSRTTPVLVSGSGAGARVFRQVAAGTEHTCAINNSGAVWCWGSNAFGALGTAGNGERVPQAVDPAPLVSQNFSSITAGESFTCGVTSGTVVCWGKNDHGQLGIGTFEHQSLQRVVASLPSAASVAAGTAFACARSGTTLYCWGNNSVGQLGVGSNAFVAHPLPMRVRH